MTYKFALALFALMYVAPVVTAAPPFSAIELHDGGHITVRSGPVQRVNLGPDVAKHATVNVTANGALVIRGCRLNCPKGYRLEAEIVTPSIANLLVSNGGSIAVAVPFPAQPALTAVVDNGGVIDARALHANVVIAQVRSGGIVLLRAERTLQASVADGGRIVYWGASAATTNVAGGGAIEKGAPAQERAPLSEFNPPLAPPPNTPPPPTPPRPPS